MDFPATIGHSEGIGRSNLGGQDGQGPGWSRKQGAPSPEQEIVNNNFPVTVKIMTSGHQTVHCNTPNLPSVRASCARE